MEIPNELNAKYETIKKVSHVGKFGIYFAAGCCLFIISLYGFYVNYGNRKMLVLTFFMMVGMYIIVRSKIYWNLSKRTKNDYMIVFSYNGIEIPATPTIDNLLKNKIYIKYDDINKIIMNNQYYVHYPVTTLVTRSNKKYHLLDSEYPLFKKNIGKISKTLKKNVVIVDKDVKDEQ